MNLFPGKNVIFIEQCVRTVRHDRRDKFISLYRRDQFIYDGQRGYWGLIFGSSASSIFDRKCVVRARVLCIDDRWWRQILGTLSFLGDFHFENFFTACFILSWLYFSLFAQVYFSFFLVSVRSTLHWDCIPLDCSTYLPKTFTFINKCWLLDFYICFHIFV